MVVGFPFGNPRFGGFSDNYSQQARIQPISEKPKTLHIATKAGAAEAQMSEKNDIEPSTIALGYMLMFALGLWIYLFNYNMEHAPSPYDHIFQFIRTTVEVPVRLVATPFVCFYQGSSCNVLSPGGLAYLTFYLALPISFLFDGEVPFIYRIISVFWRTDRSLQSEVDRRISQKGGHSFSPNAFDEKLRADKNRFETMLDTEEIRAELEKVRNETEKLVGQEEKLKAKSERQEVANELAHEIRKMELLKARLDELGRHS